MSLEQTIDNLQIRNANMVTFVGTSNTMVDTTTGRIQTKGIQHNSNVITDVSGPHGRIGPTLKKYPEFIFEEGKFEANDSTKTYVRAGYTVSSSSTFVSGTDARVAWRAFDGNADGSGNPPNIWQTHYANTFDNNSPYGIHTNNTTKGTFTADGVTYIGEWIKLKLPHKIKLNYLKWETSIDARRPKKGAILGSNNNSDWYTVKAFNNDLVWTDDNVADYAHITSSSNSAYTYFMVVIEQVQGGDGSCWGNQISLYGYEDLATQGDHSVDTTIKSRFNNPQTTGVQVLVDGATGVGTNQISGGPDPSGNPTYVTDGKYWTLNGTLTSNLSVEANTFLEGDQPHAVSVWFNSSNLEANVSNTCVFSIASEEKLDSINLDLQSNTWHNLTYAYQGEGGSRVTYLDGRKVSEDQAEDTFGDYPPFVMTGYSQGGYVVSASSENSSFPAHRAFENFPQSQNERWQTNRAYTSAGLPHTDSPTTLTYKGEWIQLEQPYKLKINYLKMQAHQDVVHQPENWVILGSNDGTIWEFIKERLDASPFNIDSNNYRINTDVIDSPKFYKYHRIVITKSGATAGNEQPIVVGISLYGHRENDLVRLPDPTNVLKYPHVSIPSSYTKRGYVVSASSDQYLYGANNIESRGAWAAFGNTGSEPGWQLYYASGQEPYNTSPDGNGFYQTNNLAPTLAGTSHRGHWIKLELPHKLMVQKMKTDHGSEPERLGQVILLGSNNDSDWYTIKDTFALTNASAQTTDINATVAYKYIVLIVKSLQNASINVDLKNLEFYGTGVDSIPIQIGGGNIDKVANFRVYDKFIEEDQVNEIWNAQKEEFGRAKPQMVLQQGKLGIGTDAPQGSLSVADEPHNLEEFPPMALTGYKTYIEGHGEFCTSESNVYTSGYESYKAFNKNSTSTSANWWTQSDAGSVPSYSTSNGEFAGSTDPIYSTNVEGATKMGHWLQIEFPYKINYRYSDIEAPQHSIGRQPRAGYILGSNDLSGMWTSLHNFTNVTRTHAYESVRYTPPTVSTQTFKYFRLVIEEMNNYQYAGIARWDIFGTREQGQSVLHDGQLTLTKNLAVPRIGPDLDADDTPRRDRLVVEYNTSTNPTFEGAVRDTSGRGNDGVFYGDARYDATEKALVFDGSGDYLEGSVHNSPGEWLHSVSMWFKRNASDSYDVLFHLGKQSAGKTSSMRLFSDNRFRFNFYDGDIEASYTVINGTWYHLVFSYSGGTDIANRKIYLNGVELTVTNVSGTPVVLNLDANEMFTLATQRAIIEGQMNCDISNFKLYDCALTAGEAKTLYDMGRCDEGHHMVNFSKTRVGIGLGDGEAPRGALDVRDKSVFSSILCQASPEDLKRGVESEGVHQVLLTFEGKKTNSDNKIHEGIQFKHYTSHQTGYRGITWQSSSDHNSSQPDFFMGGVTMAVGSGYNSCSINFHAAASRANGETRRAYIDSGNNGNRITTFTGQHRCGLRDVHLNNIESYEGIIVSANKNEYMNVNGDISRGSNAITINESIPIVTLSNIEKDKKCFGVISTSEDPETREEQHGNLTSLIEKEKGDTRVYINSVGEGAIWVVNTNGSLESGDYITTSNVAGYGQKQDDDVLHNYTVAKITMDCDFEPATQPVQQILRSNVVQTYYLGDVHHVKSVPYESNVIYDTKYTLTTTANVTESDPWDNVFIDPPEVTYATYSNLEANVQSTYTLTFTQTTTDEKTPTEWSALESNVQSLYNKVYYQSVEEEVAADYPGAVAHTRVTDKIENTLDEYGQIQWEDHPTETEKAYKVRYLTADGTQTDEANAVHIAAFVGCTYHCG